MDLPDFPDFPDLLDLPVLSDLPDLPDLPDFSMYFLIKNLLQLLFGILLIFLKNSVFSF